jgi:hypothetical protein
VSRVPDTSDLHHSSEKPNLNNARRRRKFRRPRGKLLG